MSHRAGAPLAVIQARRFAASPTGCIVLATEWYGGEAHAA
jgi:hypothetical protein